MIKNTVSVNFLGIHRQITGEDTITVDISGKITVGDLIGILNNRYPDLGLDEGAVIVTVNQVKAGPEKTLKANDVVAVLPHISGG